MMIRIHKLYCGLFERNKEAHPYFLFVSGFWVIFMGLALRFLVLGFWVNFRFSGFLGLKDKKGDKKMVFLSEPKLKSLTRLIRISINAVGNYILLDDD